VGLLTKTVIVKWHSQNKNRFVNKGYQFTKMGDGFKVKVEDLTDGSNVKVNCQCDCCGKKLKNIIWYDYKKQVKEDGKYYCQICSTKLFSGLSKRLSEKTIQEIINEKLGWDIITIKRIKTRTYLDLIDDKGYRYSNISLSNIQNNQKPSKFHKTNIYAKLNINNWCEINNLNIRLNTYNGALNNSQWLCLNCNKIFERKWGNIQSDKVLCPNCSDNISYPEKFTLCLFEQLQKIYNFNEFIYQYNPDWIKPKRYDFYFEIGNIKRMVETDGALGHGEKNTLSNQTPEESKTIDDYKDKKAEEHNSPVIRIDCKKSEMEHIRDNFLISELAEIFDLSLIDWVKCHEFACNSLVKVVCDMWNSGIKNAKEISKIIKLERGTIRRYLKQGVKSGWCDYNPEKAIKKNYTTMTDRQSKKVICLTTLEVFNSMKEAINRYNIKSTSSISICCSGKRKSAGKHPITGESLRWMCYDEYINKQNKLA
jgi:DNA-binding CsgD family transcriptional regulator